MSRRPLVVVHDREASRVPWEVLRIGDSHPALERGLSRRYASENLSVARWREDRPAGDRPRVLMVVNPTLDLPGAAREGAALRQALVDQERRSSTWKAARPRMRGCSGRSPRARTTSCTSPGTASSRRAIRRAAVSSVRPATCCAERTCRASATCRRSCSSTPARRRGCAGAARPEPSASVRPAQVQQPRRGPARRGSRELRRHALAGRRRGGAGVLDSILRTAARRRAGRRCHAGGAAARVRAGLDRLGGLRTLRQPVVPPRAAGRRDRYAVHITAGNRDPPHESGD